MDAAAVGGELCAPGFLVPAAVAGKIVLCKRGVYDRVAKSLAVDQAGGVGMILYNANDAQSQDTDNHWVPTVHVTYTQGLAIKAYIASAGASATARIVGGQLAKFAAAPSMASFSSRGPDVVAEDLIKPDVTAPGVQVLVRRLAVPRPGLRAGRAVPGHQRHLDGEPARGRRLRPHQAGASRLVAGDGRSRPS